MVLKTRQGLGQPLNFGLNNEFANGALTLRQGREVQKPQARNLAITRIRVPVTKDLQGGTDCKEGTTGLDRTLQARIGGEGLNC